jgi:hypothetical protein
LRKKDHCDPEICPDYDEDGACPMSCWVTKLDSMQSSAQGQLIRRALDLKAAIKLGVNVTLDEIAADELYAMLVIEEEADKFEEEKRKNANR